MRYWLPTSLRDYPATSKRTDSPTSIPVSAPSMYMSLYQCTCVCHSVSVCMYVHVRSMFCLMRTPPDDFSRVKLREIEDTEGSDFINASYVDVSHHTHAHTHTHMHACTYMYTHTHACMHTRSYMYAHTYARTHVHVRTHTRTYDARTHAHMHTHMLTHFPWLSPLPLLLLAGLWPPQRLHCCAGPPAQHGGGLLAHGVAAPAQQGGHAHSLRGGRQGTGGRSWGRFAAWRREGVIVAA